MGWSIQTNNVDEWGVFSSITDSIIAEFENEHDLKVWLSNEKIYEGKKKAVEILMTFPNQWNVNDKRHLGYGKKYFDWLKEIEEFDTYEDYYKAIDDKLKELMNV